jgi:hypothetical protein
MRRHLQHVQKLVAAVLRSPGATDPRLRQAVTARAAEAGGGMPVPGAAPGVPEDIPPELAPLLDKIARHAHQVTEDDLDTLRRAGYSEDALFEITVSGALGAGQSRLERGLTALRGGEK